MQKEFKPSKNPFIIIKILPALVFSIFILFLYVCAVLLVPVPIPNLVPISVFVLIAFVLGFSVVQAFVTYKKRKYVFENDRVLQYSGGIFSDSQTELLIKNITHVKRLYPFIEYGIFKTGHIRIEAAGSKESEIHINSADNVEELLNLLEESMSKNGFNLDRGDLKYTEKPHPLGVFFEVFKSFLLTVGIILYVVYDVFYEIPEIGEFLAGNSLLIGILATVIAIPVIIWFGLKFLDLLKREYKIYSNIITYTEGFLNKHYAFIPFKNLSDSATTQTIIDRIFGLFDVKLSAQGSGHEVLFKNLERGKEISETLDELIDQYSDDVEGAAKSKEGETASTPLQEKDGRRETKAGVPEHALETEYTDDFKMNMARQMFPVYFFAPIVIIGFIFPVVLIVVFVGAVSLIVPLFIQANFTRYYIKKKSMLSRYKFLNAREVEFNNEKITGMVIKRNFIDYWFNTATFKFYSIGAGANLDFRNVDYSDELSKKIQAKTGVTLKNEVYNINSEFSFSESLRASLFFVAFVFLLVAIWLFCAGTFFVSRGYSFLWALAPLIPIALVWLVIYIYQVFYYKRSKLYYYEDVVYFQKGIFFKSFYYIRYDNIKDITTTKYPFSEEGDIRFNIAGETIVQTQQGKSTTSNHFTIKYVPDIPVQDELVDFILLRMPSADEIKDYLDNPSKYPTKRLKDEIPSMKNPMSVAILILLIPNAAVLFLILSATQVNNVVILLAIFLALVDVFILGLVALYTLMKEYVVENTRVLARWGIFYKKQTSVVFEKIDFLNNNQNFLNKIFGNGNITVNTLGSSRAELNVNNINNYKDFYKDLHETYKNFDI